MAIFNILGHLAARMIYLLVANIPSLTKVSCLEVRIHFAHFLGALTHPPPISPKFIFFTYAFVQVIGTFAPGHMH